MRLLIIALFSLAFITGCTTPTKYDTRTCPAPLTASGCAEYLWKR